MRNDYRLNLPRRPRRLRRNDGIRALVRETRLSPADLIQPIFVVEGDGADGPVESMPGIKRLTLSSVVKECVRLRQLGLRGVALFPCLSPIHKTIIHQK